MNRFNAQTRRFAQAAAAGALVLASSVPAHAAMDVTGAVTAIEGVATPAGLVGGAVFILLIGIAGWKWLRKAA